MEAFVGPTITLADKFGLIQAVNAKLIRRPDPAADKLATVLAELGKFYGVLENATTQYLALSFYEGQDPAERRGERETLLALEGGTIRAQMAQARAHSHKILNIYNRFLNPWFGRVLNNDEVAMMADLFGDFRHYDGSFVDQLEGLGNQLAQQARETLDLVDAGELEEANQRIIKARTDYRPLRDALLDANLRLSRLEAVFTESAGPV